MSVTLFVYADAAVAPEVLAPVLDGLPGLAAALMHTPVAAMPDYPFAKDGHGPALALELQFASLAHLEAALSADALGRLALANPRHQVLERRDFPVTEPASSQTAEMCTFLVQYVGETSDREAWLDHYDRHHPPIMGRFPGIRQVATYRPLAWTSALPWGRAEALQRNKVVFDSANALAHALASPIMAEMRADRSAFPAFTGTSAHYPMHTRSLR